MTNMPMDKLLAKTGSAYKLVALAFTRAIELNAGAARLVDTKPDEKDISIALREILAGKVSLKEKESK